jgi:hypothetical protein
MGVVHHSLLALLLRGPFALALHRVQAAENKADKTDRNPAEGQAEHLLLTLLGGNCRLFPGQGTSARPRRIRPGK